jgi:sugar lactone lactonase YvrE
MNVTGVEPVVESHALLGEGPVWSQSEQALFWVDILGRTVHRLDAASAAVQTFHMLSLVGCVVLRRSGGLIVVVSDGVASYDCSTHAFRMLVPIDSISAAGTATRMNDGKCDRAGRLWVGSRAGDGHDIGSGALYRLDCNLALSRQLGGITISNGIDWSPDDSTMYYVDSSTGGVDAFDFDLVAGAISNRRRLVSISEDEGVPDGITIDAEGGLWVALWGGGAVHRYEPDGTKSLVLSVPASLVTSCTFGGPDLSDLYITSATVGLSEDDLLAHPMSGAVFRYHPGVRGLPANEYCG